MDIDFVGYVAGFLMAISFIPQAIRSIRTKDTTSISLPTYLLYVSAVVLWLAYGVLLHNAPMIFWNAITLAVSGSVLYAKLRYG